MKKQIVLVVLLSAALLVLNVSCKKEKKEKSFKPEPPIEKLNPAFTEITVDAGLDGVYKLENGTTISIPAGSLQDSLGKPLTSKITLNYRQFDNAVSIFLSGLPMDFSNTAANMGLQTAGMFEIRSTGKTVTINPDKPIKVTIGSFFDDTRQGFFKLDDQTGNWQLMDIPESRINQSIDSLRKKIKTLKSEWSIPLPPNFFVFDFTRMADIFIGEDKLDKIWKANLKAMAKKMEGYGVKSLALDLNRTKIEYKGNRYDHGEMLWKADKNPNIPSWVYKMEAWHQNKDKKWVSQIEIEKQSNNRYLFICNDFKKNQKFTFTLEAVCHLRYLLKYTPEQLLAKQKEVEQEIEETERTIRESRIVEYTVVIYSMGIYNCDRPILYSSFQPELAFMVEGKPIDKTIVKKVAVFNSDLSSVSYQISMEPLLCPFFKGTNKIAMVTNDGKIGLLTGKQFDALTADSAANIKSLNIPLTMTTVNSEAELMEKLKE